LTFDGGTDIYHYSGSTGKIKPGQLD